jgi:hypothetical protein
MDQETRSDLEATVQARRELGPAHDDELIEGFLERLDRRLDEGKTARELERKARRDHQKEMILGAMGISIPLLAIAAVFAGLAGIIVVCAALGVIATAVSRSS